MAKIEIQCNVYNIIACQEGTNGQRFFSQEKWEMFFWPTLNFAKQKQKMRKLNKVKQFEN